MQQYIAEFMSKVTAYVPQVVGALCILVIGLMVAWAVAIIIKVALSRTTLDNKLAGWILGAEKADNLPIESALARCAFYTIVLITAVAFFEALGLTVVTQPLNRFLNEIFTYAPRILGAGALLLLAWAIASIARLAVGNVLRRTNLDKKVADEVTDEKTKALRLSDTMGDVVYYLVFLFFLPAILDTLGMTAALRPIQEMLTRISNFLPNILAALLTALVGWFVARIVQRIVTGLLLAAKIDDVANKVGAGALGEKQQVSKLIGYVIYVLILIPVVIQALDNLQLKAITDPAKDMLSRLLLAVPLIFGAALIMVFSYVVAKLVSSLVTNVLAAAGFNRILSAIGFNYEPEGDNKTPAAIVGYVVMVALMMAASIEAANMLNFSEIAGMIGEFMVFGAKLIMGLLIFGFGLWLANLASKTVLATGHPQEQLLAFATRLAIVILTGAMALRHMELANEIINTAFGLLLGAISVAVALAFGLGSKEVAGDLVRDWVGHLKQGGAAKIESTSPQPDSGN